MICTNKPLSTNPYIHGLPVVLSPLIPVLKWVPNPAIRKHRKKRIMKKWNRGVPSLISVPDHNVLKMEDPFQGSYLVMNPATFEILKAQIDENHNRL